MAEILHIPSLTHMANYSCKMLSRIPLARVHPLQTDRWCRRQPCQ